MVRLSGHMGKKELSLFSAKYSKMRPRKMAHIPKMKLLRCKLQKCRPRPKKDPEKNSANGEIAFLCCLKKQLVICLYYISDEEGKFFSGYVQGIEDQTFSLVFVQIFVTETKIVE